jgi:uncharacterized protein YuzB (UPF0349 family)
MGKDKRYFNVPVQLLQGFIPNTAKCLNNIFDYAIFDHAINKLEYDDDVSRIKAACKYFGVTAGSNDKTLANGEALHSSIPNNSPKFGLNIDLFFDYYKNHKTDFEKASLLMFLALKSIVQNKAYCKITNAYLWARMDGKASTLKPFDELSQEVKFFTSEYQTNKIKKELRNNWQLVYYGRYTRGCYYSFNLDLDQLVYVVEKKRKSNLNKAYKQQELEAINKALNKIKYNN